jgi:nucleotide sugar dehydrogenase
MPAVLRLKSEEVDTPEKRSKYTITVIGGGKRGVLYAVAFSEVGFKVICAEADQSILNRLAKGIISFDNDALESKFKNHVRTKQITPTNDLKTAISQSAIVIMTVSVNIDVKKNPTYAEIVSNCKKVGASLQKGSLVIYGGISGFGSTEGLIKDTIENTSGLKAGEDFGLAYHLFQNYSENAIRPIGADEIVIGSKDRFSLNSTAVIFGTIINKGIKTVTDFKKVELAALFTALRIDSKLALENELAIFCESAGINYFEISELLSDDKGTTVITPSVTDGNSQKETYLLLENAERLNAKLRLSALARQINEEMVRHAINLTQEALRIKEKTLRRAKIAILSTEKPNKAIIAFGEILDAKGARVSIYDPNNYEKTQIDNKIMHKRTLKETTEGADCLILLGENEQFKRLNLKRLRAIMKPSAAIVDLAGVIEPEKARNEGFSYVGLGRGAQK